MARAGAAPAALALRRRHGGAFAVADGAGRWPLVEAVTSPLVYVRLHGDQELYRSGYRPHVLDAWAERVRAWHAAGHDVEGYFDTAVAAPAPAAAHPRQAPPAPATPAVAPTPPAPGATPAPTSPESDREAVAVRLRALPGVAAVEALGTAGEGGRRALVGPLRPAEEAAATAAGGPAPAACVWRPASRAARGAASGVSTTA